MLPMTAITPARPTQFSGLREQVRVQPLTPTEGRELGREVAEDVLDGKYRLAGQQGCLPISGFGKPLHMIGGNVTLLPVDEQGSDVARVFYRAPQPNDRFGWLGLLFRAPNCVLESLQVDYKDGTRKRYREIDGLHHVLQTLNQALAGKIQVLRAGDRKNKK